MRQFLLSGCSQLGKRITVQQERFHKINEKKVPGHLRSLINFACTVESDQRLFHTNCNVLVRPLRKGRHFLGKEVKGGKIYICITTKGGF